MFNQFQSFKGKHSGESAILFATGPSVKDFSYALLPESPTVRVGVQKIIFNDDISLDYFFSADVRTVGDQSADALPTDEERARYMDKIVARSTDIQAFCCCGVFVGGESIGVEDDGYFRDVFHTVEEAERMNAILFELHSRKGSEHFTTDIVSDRMYDQSIVFSPLEFLLYAGVKRIYLVGCDSTPHGEFKSEEEEYFCLRWHWEQFAEFKDKEYPDVEIVSVNPRNLKDLFSCISG